MESKPARSFEASLGKEHNTKQGYSTVTGEPTKGVSRKIPGGQPKDKTQQ